MTLSVASVLLVSNVGCEASPPAVTTRRVAEREAANKATFYADATLLPDRGSARRREEAAVAAEIDALCELMPGVLHVRSSVSLADTPSAVVVVQHDTHFLDDYAGSRDDEPAPGQGEGASLERMIETIAAGVVPGAEIEVLTLLKTPPSPIASPPPDGAPDSTHGPFPGATRSALWLALGITLGVLFERIATRRSQRRAR